MSYKMNKTDVANIQSEIKKYESHKIVCFSLDMNEQKWHENTKSWKKDIKFPTGWQNFSESTINNRHNALAILTGETSGLFVVDIDDVKYWDDLLKMHGKNEPETVKVKTASGGYHFYFKYTEDLDLLFKKNAGDIKINGQSSHIDIRSTGGCIIAPPTKYYNKNFSGKETKYEWERDIENFEIEEIPDWLVEILLDKKNKKKIENIVEKVDKKRKIIDEDIEIKQEPIKNEKRSRIVNFTHRLIDNLNSDYFDSYHEWWKVSSYLKKYTKIDNYNYYDLFNDFSEKSKKKYCKDSNDKYWNGWDGDKIHFHIGNLCNWSRESNLSEHKKIMKEFHVNLDLSEDGFAITINKLAGDYFIFKDGILYSFDTKTKFWYADRYEVIKNYINDELYDYYFHLINDSFDDTSDRYKEQMKILKKYCKTNKYKEELIKSYKNRFILPVNTEEDAIEFDAKKFLFGFNNGVFDLQTGEFRDYEYDDYITIRTSYNYRKSTVEEKKLIQKIFDQIETEKDKLHLLYQILGSGFINSNYGKFCIFTGVGSNGKSLINKFMNVILNEGVYYYKGNYNSFCESEGKSGSADPTIASFDRKRYIVFSEPKESKKIQNSKLKAWTGDSTINARMLHSNKTSIKMKATFVLECNNKPNFEEECTNAEIRRMINYVFKSRFEESGIDESNRIFLREKKYVEDDQFVSNHKFAFFEIVAAACKKFINEENESFILPQSVQNDTEAYINSSFDYLEFFNSVAVKTDNKDDYISIKDLFDKYKNGQYFDSLTKEQKRKKTKANMIDFFGDKCKMTSGIFSSRKMILGSELRNIITKYKFIEEDF